MGGTYPLSGGQFRDQLFQDTMVHSIPLLFYELRPRQQEDIGASNCHRHGTRFGKSRKVFHGVIHPAYERLGLPKAGWHGLRHTRATLLREHEALRVTTAGGGKTPTPNRRPTKP